MISQRQKITYTRQLDIIPQNLLSRKISVIGAGAISSFAALAVGKMGATDMESFDEDGVSAHNLPNTFYRKNDINNFKVSALAEILSDFTDTILVPVNKFYINQKLQETVIVATDSMASRKTVWLEFLKQEQAHYLIEARMGAQNGRVYTIKKVQENSKWVVPKNVKDFYEKTLYDDSKVAPVPCTNKAIIYNVLMISSLIARAYKAIITNENIPKEILVHLTHIDERTFMFRD
jgi:hypothetical protein